MPCSKCGGSNDSPWKWCETCRITQRAANHAFLERKANGTAREYAKHQFRVFYRRRIDRPDVQRPPRNASGSAIVNPPPDQAIENGALLFFSPMPLPQIRRLISRLNRSTAAKASRRKKNPRHIVEPILIHAIS